MSFKNTKINTSHLLVISIVIYYVYCILFPRDMLNIKEMLLLLSLFFCYFSRKIYFKIPVSLFLLGFIYPVFCILYSFIRGNSIGSAVSYGYVWISLLLLPGIVANRIDLLKPFIYGTYVVAIITDIILLCDVLGIVSVYSNPITLAFKSLGELQGVGKGALSTFGYSIFYKSCPLIIVSYCYFIAQKKYLLGIPLLLALFGCGTRANFLVAVFATLLIPVMCEKKKIYKLILIGAVGCIAIYFLPILVEKMTNLNMLKSAHSDSIKSMDMEIILNSMFGNVANIFFGTGVGSSFLSSRGHYLSTFELSFVDYFRQAGILGLGVLTYFIIKPLKWLYFEQKWLFIGFLCYIAVSFTNPLLVTSTSFVLYLLVYSQFLEGKKKDNTSKELLKS